MAKHLTAPDRAARAPRRPRRRYLFAAVLALVGVVAGFVAFTMSRAHTANPVSAVAEYFVPPPETYFGKERVYALLLGIDYDYDDKGQPYSSHSRSDTIKIAALDFPTHQIRLLSVPRDMDAVIGGREMKINEAYSLGGVNQSDRVIGKWLGLSPNEHGRYFDRHVVVRINALKEMVDAIGGVDVDVDETMNYDDNWAGLHIHLKKGPQHLNGYNAVAYSRFRHDACSDPCRIKRQDQVIQAVLQKVKNDKFNDLTHIASLMGVVNRNVTSDFSGDEERSLAWAFRDVSTKALQGDQVPYVDTKDVAYDGEVLIPDERKRAQLVAQLTGPYVVETPAPAAALAKIDRRAIHLDVRNGSGTPGVGGRAAAALKHLGYAVDSVGNADSFDYDVTRINAAGQPAHLGDRVRRDLRLPNATIAPLTTSTAPANVATVIVGRDYATALAGTVTAAK